MSAIRFPQTIAPEPPAGRHAANGNATGSRPNSRPSNEPVARPPLPTYRTDYDGSPLEIRTFDRLDRPFEGMRFHVH